MKIAISKLPNNPWWGTGVIGYKDNPAMKNGAIPDQGILKSERSNLINTMKKNKIDVVEFTFPKDLEFGEFGHDFVFIRDTFISDLNGNALLLKFSQKNRDAETNMIAESLEKLDFNVKELPSKHNIFAEGGEFYYCAKENLLFTNFELGTGKKNSIRKPILDTLKRNDFETKFNRVDQKKYWLMLASSKFSISPEGGGIDCHRIWECIFLKTIPIVYRHIAFKQFEELPILFIDNWNIITREFLEEQWIKFSQKTFNIDKIYTEYWKNKINK